MTNNDRTALLYATEVAHQIVHNVTLEAEKTGTGLSNLPDSVISSDILYMLSLALIAVVDILEKEQVLGLDSTKLTNRNFH